jgi:serine/threonine protein kinase
VTLNDFSMLSMIGIGNYAKVILVRRKTSGRIYAMKIVKKKKEHENEMKGLKKAHAYIEKEILVTTPLFRVNAPTPSSSNCTPPSKDRGNSTISFNIVLGGSSSE